MMSLGGVVAWRHSMYNLGGRTLWTLRVSGFAYLLRFQFLLVY